MSKITNDGLTRSGKHRMLYKCINMEIVDVKGLMNVIFSSLLQDECQCERDFSCI